MSRPSQQQSVLRLNSARYLDDTTKVFSKSASPNSSATVLPVVILWIFAASFLAFLFLQESIPYEALLLDPDLASNTPWYAGLIWGFSILGWTTATVAALASGWICRLAGRQRASRMLMRGAMLSTLFLLDNLFQLGSRFAAFFNIPQSTVTVACISASILWAFIERSELQRTRVELVATAIAALVSALLMSTIALAIFNVDSQRVLIAASAAEFLGVLALAQYFVLTGADIVRSIFMNLRAKSSDRQVEPHDLGQPSAEVTMTPRGNTHEAASM